MKGFGLSPRSSERRQLHAVVGAQSYENWQELATEAGVNLTSLIDALGNHLDALPKGKQWKAVVDDAREIATQRRRRLPQSPTLMLMSAATIAVGVASAVSAVLQQQL